MLESKLFHKVRKLAGKAVGDFSLTEAGERIAIGALGNVPPRHLQDGDLWDFSGQKNSAVVNL